MASGLAAWGFRDKGFKLLRGVGFWCLGFSG